MDVGGRIMSGTIIEEIESRLEQRPRECPNPTLSGH